MTGPAKGAMTQAHKDALAVGRTEGRAVREYLEALRHNKPKRGRKRTVESVDHRLEVIEAEMPTAGSVERLMMIQERYNLTAERETFEQTADMGEVTKAFVAVAKSYSARQSISYASWREVGVPASVLKDAGISRYS